MAEFSRPFDPHQRKIDLRDYSPPPAWLSRECDSDKRPASPEMAAHIYERLGRLVAELMSRCGTLILSHQEDDDFTLNFAARSGRVRTMCACRSTLVETLEVALNKEEMKVCVSCHLLKGIGQFGPHRTTADGRSTSCRSCESERICALQKRQREARAAAAKAKRSPR